MSILDAIKVSSESVDNVDEEQIVNAIKKALFFETYEVYTFFLSSPRELYEVDVEKDLGVPAKKLIVLRSDDIAYIILNNPKNKRIEAVPNLDTGYFTIRKFFISNPASSDPNAKLIILVFG